MRFLVKYGTIVSFRYLFRTGPERSETRDYVFVEFSSREVCHNHEFYLEWISPALHLQSILLSLPLIWALRKANAVSFILFFIHSALVNVCVTVAR